MEYIKSKLSDDLARKIIGSQEKATEYLLRLNDIKPIPSLKFKTISRGVDFFINGVSFDQKVAKSPTNEFKRHYKDGWREIAIKKPELVAEYLYKFQDEGRFGADPRLLVVYIDEDVSIDKIREIINKTDLNNPVEINFTYKHKNLGEKNYKVPCFVILLHN